MTAVHCPVHPVLRTGRGPHPWVRRRRLVGAAGVTAGADTRLPAAAPVSARPACLARDAGCSEPQSPAAGAPGPDLSFAALIGLAYSGVGLGCSGERLVEERAS